MFDGHGGSEASAVAAEELHELLVSVQLVVMATVLIDDVCFSSRC